MPLLVQNIAPLIACDEGTISTSIHHLLLRDHFRVTTWHNHVTLWKYHMVMWNYDKTKWSFHKTVCNFHGMLWLHVNVKLKVPHVIAWKDFFVGLSLCLSELLTYSSFDTGSVSSCQRGRSVSILRKVHEVPEGLCKWGISIFTLNSLWYAVYIFMWKHETITL